jgi:hypothetical protein
LQAGSSPAGCQACGWPRRTQSSDRDFMRMRNDVDHQSRSDPPRGEDDGGKTLSGREILFVMTLIALAVVGGYFFLMKMIDVSQQEDCFLAQRRNCAPTEPFRH